MQYVLQLKIMKQIILPVTYHEPNQVIYHVSLFLLRFGTIHIPGKSTCLMCEFELPMFWMGICSSPLVMPF